MIDKINGRTPEEIKRGLECCYNDDRPICEKCPYHYVRKDGQLRFTECSDRNRLGVDALAYINRLEETYSQLKKSLQDRGFEDFYGLFEAYEKLKSGVPQWVSVADEVPREAGSYIVCTDRGAVCTARFYAKDGIFAGVAGRHVTHWMHLPKAPKEG